MKIAVDAMGGDYAPEAIVEGAVQAAQEYGTSIMLVGQEDRIFGELEQYKTADLDITVKHASQIVDMHDLPSFALRRKTDSSLHGAINLLREGAVDAAVSAGNTGAAMAISKVACRMLEGIERPAIATVMPNVNGVTIIVDIGANVDCKPFHLLQFAVMGHVYAKEMFGVENPRVGLLSTGEEPSKGNTLTKETFEPLSRSKLNFIGNVEGRDVFNGRVDVIVCDGFIGNVVLKVSESLAKTIGAILKEGFSKNWRTKLGYLLVKSEIEHLKKRTDDSEYGGAPLLGLNGVVIIGHGSSKAKSLKNAIRVASESVEHRIQEQIVATLQEYELDLKSWKRATSFWRRFRKSSRHEDEKGKSLAVNQEEPDLKEPQVHTAPPMSAEEAPQVLIAEQEDFREVEQERKSWWHLRDSRGREVAKPEPAEESEKPEPEQTEESMAAPEPEQSLVEKMLSQEARPERTPWWRLKNPRPREQVLSDAKPEPVSEKQKAGSEYRENL